MDHSGKDSSDPRLDAYALRKDIRAWSKALGFQQTGFASIDLSEDELRLEQWLAQDRHGEMSYMARHGTRRSRPAELVDGTRSVITVRMDYLPEATARAITTLENSAHAYVSRYALGRDYHKVLRRRLQQLANRIEEKIGPFGYRAFTDSAPVLEKPLARNGGLGWIGKHTNLINKQAGSWFFLGELYTDLALPPDQAPNEHCGTCTACIEVCPTQAIVAPFELDARRCISYLTIELEGAIPEELRALMGNRIYGCDDCQLFCPWNKYAQPTAEDDFRPRHGLADAELIDLFSWSETEWLEKTTGSAIRRIGYKRWLRNIAVGLGNAPTTPDVLAALEGRRNEPDDMVREHIHWALQQHGKSAADNA